MIVVENQYEIGQTVYLRTDTDQVAHIVTAIVINPGNSLSYEIVICNTMSKHNEFELSPEPDHIIKTSN